MLEPIPSSNPAATGPTKRRPAVARDGGGTPIAWVLNTKRRDQSAHRSPDEPLVRYEDDDDPPSAYCTGATGAYRRIYRVFPSNRALEVFRQRCLTLVRPHLWEDPFENFALRLRAVDSDGSRLRLVSNELFGQCWTTNMESDALWRIYAPDGDGVLVRTTMGRLRQEGNWARRYIESARWYFGVVQYRKAEEILQRLRSRRFAAQLVRNPTDAIAWTLFQKRREFSHESEVRLLLRVAREFQDRDAPIYRVPIDPYFLIDSIVLDPRFSPKRARMLAGRLRHAGYEGPIVLSELYGLPGRVPLLKLPAAAKRGPRRDYFARALSGRRF